MTQFSSVYQPTSFYTNQLSLQGRCAANDKRLRSARCWGKVSSTLQDRPLQCTVRIPALDRETSKLVSSLTAVYLKNYFTTLLASGLSNTKMPCAVCCGMFSCDRIGISVAAREVRVFQQRIWFRCLFEVLTCFQNLANND